MKLIKYFGIVFFLLFLIHIGYSYIPSSSIDYYNMDEASGNLADSVGSITGTVSGMNYSNAGILNTAIGSTATSDYVDFGDNWDAASYGNQVSVSFWFKYTSGTTGYLITKAQSGDFSFANPYLASGNIGITQYQASGSVYRNFATTNGTYGDGNWHFVYMYMSNSDSEIFVDGALAANSTAASGTWDTNSAAGFRVGGRTGYTDANIGRWDEMSIYGSTRLGASTVLNIYNNYLSASIFTPQIQTNLTNGGYYPRTTLTLSANTTTPVNMSYSLDGASFVQFGTNTNQTTFTLSGLSQGNHNISLKSVDKLTPGYNYNNITFYVDTQPPSLNVTNNSISNSYSVNFSSLINYSDNFAVSQCLVYTENTSFSCDNQSFTYHFNGNQSFNVSVNDSAGNFNNSFNNKVFINPYQYFYFTDYSSNQLTNFIFGGKNYTSVAKIKTYSLGLGNHNLSFEKTGFESISVNFTLNTTSSLNETIKVPIALLYLNIYDLNTQKKLSQYIAMQLIGSDFAGEFHISNGSITITNITNLPGSYELDLASSGYADISYFFTHTGFDAVNLSLYMENVSDTTPITYQVYDSFENLYDSICLVKISVYQLSTNSYIPFTEGYTNSGSEVIFDLDLSKRYKPSVTCNGQTQVYEAGKITSTPIPLKFTTANLNVFSTIPTVSSSMKFVTLSNTSGRFKFTYDDSQGIVSQGCLNVTQINYNKETFVGISCISGASGSINVDFNTTMGVTYKATGLVKYNGEFYPADQYYKKIIATENNWGIWGVIFALVVIVALAIIGAIAGKAKGSLIGATIALWISSSSIFGIWYFPISGPLVGWSVLLLLGVIFT